MTNGNEPAFSKSAEDKNSSLAINKPYLGLTKRELFAAMALEGLMAGSTGGRILQPDLDYWAQSSVKAADALIAALNQGGE